MRSRGVVIVGASVAGLAAAEGLRHFGHGDRIVLVGDEPHLPYDRPPLSKQLLSGEWDRDKLQLRTAAAYEELDVELRLGTPAGSLDVAGHRVGLADGTFLDYDQVVVATGVRARTLPGTEGIKGVHVLRTLDDALALTTDLAARPRLVIVGGGFIGAEAAAVASGLGCDVVMVTDQRVPLADAVGADIGGMLTEAHRAHGIHMETEALVEAVVSDGVRATGVKLVDGRVLRADTVLIGIGARPNVEWLEGSGLAVGNGVLCDTTLWAAPDVWAAGDVASWPDPVTGEQLRIEHRTNAAEQGLAVARNILAGPGKASAFTSVPYVWSDQYDMKIQIYGPTRGADAVRIVDGDLASRRFTALFGRDGRVTAAVGVNMVRPLRALRPLVADRADWASVPVAA